MGGLENDLSRPPGGGRALAKQAIDASGTIIAQATDVLKPQPLSHWLGSLARQDPDTDYFLTTDPNNAGSVYKGGLSGMSPAGVGAQSTNPTLSPAATNVKAGDSEVTYLMFTEEGDVVYVNKGTQGASTNEDIDNLLGEILDELDSIETTLTDIDTIKLPLDGDGNIATVPIVINEFVYDIDNSPGPGGPYPLVGQNTTGAAITIEIDGPSTPSAMRAGRINELLQFFCDTTGWSVVAKIGSPPHSGHTVWTWAPTGAGPWYLNPKASALPANVTGPALPIETGWPDANYVPGQEFGWLITIPNGAYYAILMRARSVIWNTANFIPGIG